MRIFAPYTMLEIRYLPRFAVEVQNQRPILWTFGFNSIFARVLSEARPIGKATLKRKTHIQTGYGRKQDIYDD